MNKTLQTLAGIALFFFMLPASQAQYTTPGNNLSLSLQDLVSMSGGVVTFSDGDYFVNNTLMISATDTLKILQAETIRVAQGVRLEFQGKFISDPQQGRVVFTAQDTTAAAANFRGFRFEDADMAIFRNTVVKYGGGIQLIATEAVFEHSVFRNNGFSNVSAAITYSNCNPIVYHCEFRENARSAMASGANVVGSPQIFYSRFIHNTTDNSNRPQLNLGPGGADSIRFVGNYVEGLYTNAGGIAISNTLSVGSTKALVKDNLIVENRYGYAQVGGNISSVIRNNTMIHNNIQNNPGLGGSGINFAGPASSQSVVRENLIYGNLWGITVQNAAVPNMGTADDHGRNVIFGNENNFYENEGAFIHSIANATAGILTAIGNYLGSNDLETASHTLYPRPDEMGNTTILYAPIMTLEIELQAFSFTQNLNPDLLQDYVGELDEENLEIHFLLPYNVDVTSLVPEITTPLGVFTSPASGVAVDFSDPVVYTLSLPHGDEQQWTVFVELDDPPVFTLTFQVEDEQGNAIPNAVISLEGSAYDEGVYVIEDLLTGSYEFMVSAPGFYSVEGTIEIIDQDVQTTVVLQIDDTSAADQIQAGIRVYPVPASDFLLISNPGYGDGKVRLLDVAGRELARYTLPQGELKLAVGSYLPGIYVLEFSFENLVVIRKFSVSR